MIIEFWGGPRDGEQMAVPDGGRFIELALMKPLTQVKATGDVVSVDTVRCYFGRRDDGTIIARWPNGCA